jgi:hypothetical protein
MVAITYGYDEKLVVPSSLTEYETTHPSIFMRNGSISNSSTKKILNLTFKTITEGIAEIRKQEQ